MKQIGYRIPPEQKPCKFGKHWMEDLAGDGGSRCPMFECEYDGDKVIPDDFVCSERPDCIAYEPCLTRICEKHNIEYYAEDYCELCHPENNKWREKEWTKETT